MSTDRPPSSGSGADAPRPDPAASTQPAPRVEDTQPVAPAEPTPQLPDAPGSWASGAGEWSAPDPAQIWRAQGQSGDAQLPRPVGEGWQNQPGQLYGTGWHPGWAPPGSGQQPGREPQGPPQHWAAAPPPPLAGYPPQVTPPGRGRGWLVALATLAAVVVVSLIAALAVPVLADLPHRSGGAATAAPTSRVTPAPTPSGTPPTPEPKPTPTMPTDPTALLKRNPVYGLKVPATCSHQSIPASQAAFRTQVRRLVDCQDRAWKKALSKTPVRFIKPKVKFYSSSTKTPCGKLGTTFPASYCSSSATIYFSRATYLQGRYYRLSVAHFVIHEYAHHVQALAGILDARQALEESPALTSRRIELQAHCIAHYGLTVSRLGFSSRDRQSIAYQWDYSNDPKGHGSTKAERYWGQRGLKAKNLAACNTWTAKSARVK